MRTHGLPSWATYTGDVRCDSPVVDIKWKLKPPFLVESEMLILHVMLSYKIRSCPSKLNFIDGSFLDVSCNIKHFEVQLWGIYLLGHSPIWESAIETHFPDGFRKWMGFILDVTRGERRNFLIISAHSYSNWKTLRTSTTREAFFPVPCSVLRFRSVLYLCGYPIETSCGL